MVKYIHNLFQPKFDTICVIVPVENKTMIVKEEAEEETESSENEEDLDEDWQPGPARKKRKVFPLSDVTLTLLDRTMVNDTAAAAILTANVVDLGLDSEQLSTSASTIRRHRETVIYCNLLKLTLYS